MPATHIIEKGMGEHLFAHTFRKNKKLYPVQFF